MTLRQHDYVRAIILYGLLVLGMVLDGGCMAGRATAETARIAACQETEQRIEDRHAEGEVSYSEARLRLTCVREVCDEIREQLGGDDGGE